jgi:hypothetical protein
MIWACDGEKMRKSNEILFENLKEKDHLADLRIDGSKIKITCKYEGVIVLTGFISLSTESNGSFL